MPRPDPARLDLLLDHVRTHAGRHLASLDERPVRPQADAAQLRDALGGPLPNGPSDPVEVLDLLAATAERGTIATSSARFFGFVVGGALPAPMAADMLTPVWDQNAALYVIGPVAAVAEEVARTWLLDLLGLPPDASMAFVTGGQMANTTALLAARHHVLAAAGWDVELNGLAGGPAITVLAGRERHSSIDRAMRQVGLGARPVLVDVDVDGAMVPDALAAALDDVDGPAIVCAQMGNVNTGALDPVGPLSDIAHDQGAWVHVDGAFGLWAACLPRLREETDGVGRADSWAVDAHKWLNVPYDAGLAVTAHPASHGAALGTDADQSAYLQFGEGTRDAVTWTPEFSRRGRGVPVWAALRSLGRQGVIDMVERGCAMAQRFAELLDAQPGVHVRNFVEPGSTKHAADRLRRTRNFVEPGSTKHAADLRPQPTVPLNQVLVGFDDVDVGPLIAAVQDDGTCWLSGTTWRGEQLMRISVSNWQTDPGDVDRSVDAILRCHRALRS